MHTLAVTNKSVFKKRIYINAEKSYVTWYLFVITDRIYSNKDAENHFTAHANNTNLFANRNFSDSKFCDDENNGDIHTEAKKSQSSSVTIENPAQSKPNAPINKEIYTSKWYLPEALKFFLPCLYYNSKLNNKEILVDKQKNIIVKHLLKQQERFRHAMLKFDGWKDTIFDKDEDCLYTTKDAFSLQNKCKYLFHAVKSMIHNYN